MKHAIIMAVAALAIAGCSQKHAAEEAVRKRLKDPESARFGNFYYNDATKRACLTVNAKNSMGGYTGDQQVQLENAKEGWLWITEMENTEDVCRRLWADRKPG